MKTYDEALRELLESARDRNRPIAPAQAAHLARLRVVHERCLAYRRDCDRELAERNARAIAEEAAIDAKLWLPPKKRY